MASFNEHLDQARHNYSFSLFLCSASDKFFDWKVTVNFYISVHLINALLAYEKDAHYRRHKDVEIAINPFNGECAVPKNIYLSYKKLHNLSRRSRYLIHEDDHMYPENNAHQTSENHFKKSNNRLREIIDFIAEKYNVSIEPNATVV